LGNADETVGKGRRAREGGNIGFRFVVGAWAAGALLQDEFASGDGTRGRVMVMVAMVCAMKLKKEKTGVKKSSIDTRVVVCSGE